MSNQIKTKTPVKYKQNPSRRQAAREILMLCITAAATPGRKARLAKLASGAVDWEYLLELAEFHSISPLIYHSLKVNGLTGRVKKSCLDRLHHVYDEILYRNVIFSAELSNLLSAFDKRGIPVIALKGIALAEMLYDNLAVRKMVDLDILVPRDDLQQAGSLLNEMGYQQPESDGTTHPFHGPPYFKQAALPFFVELHWGLEDESLITIPYEKIWERAQTLQFQWGQTRILSYEDTLLFSVVQLFKQLDQLKILGDISGLLKKYEKELDWAYIVAAARSWGIPTFLYYSLLMARELPETPAPPPIIKELRPGIWLRWAIEFLLNREAFISPVKWKKIRIEYLVIVRSLMMGDLQRALYVLKKYRAKGLLRTTVWMIIVPVYALWRKIAGMISSRI